jgi:DNA-binding LacI/PurR family transcriptional regulator
VLAQQRHDYVLDQLRAHGAIRVTDVVTGLGVSDGTVRRDLEVLEQQGLLVRVRGGAMLPGGSRPGGSAADGHDPSPDLEPGEGPGGRPAAGSASGVVLGMLVPSSAYYYPAVIRGAQSAVARAGARLVLGVTDYDRERDLEQLRDLIRSGCDGLLVTTATGPVVPAPVLELLEGSGLPYVLVERRSAAVFDHADCVLSDHAQGAYRAVARLAALGHRSVALFVQATPTARLVAEGYAEAVRLLGLDGSAPVSAPELGADRLDQIDAFARACRESAATAALVHSDQEAILLVQRLRAQGVEIPGELAVIAYDDEVAAFAEVPLTAVAPQKFEVGRTAGAALLDRIAAVGPRPARQTVLQPALVIRDSSGLPVPAAADPQPAEQSAEQPAQQPDPQPGHRTAPVDPSAAEHRVGIR